jgi:hypothetical protein
MLYGLLKNAAILIDQQHPTAFRAEQFSNRRSDATAGTSYNGGLPHHPRSHSALSSEICCAYLRDALPRRWPLRISMLR